MLKQNAGKSSWQVEQSQWWGIWFELNFNKVIIVYLEINHLKFAQLKLNFEKVEIFCVSSMKRAKSRVDETELLI